MLIIGLLSDKKQKEKLNCKLYHVVLKNNVTLNL